MLTGLKLRELCKTDLTPDMDHRTLRPASGAYRPVPYPSWARHCLHWTLRLYVRCLNSQRPVSEEHSRDFSKFPTGAIENMHFIFSKSACGGINPYTLTARLQLGSLAHYETSSRLDPTARVSCKETRRGDQAGF